SLAVVLATGGRRTLDGSRRPGEARCRGRLQEAIALDESTTRPIMRMQRGLLQAEHRGETDVRTLQQRTPLLATALAEQPSQACLQTWPGATVHLRSEVRLVQANEIQQLRVERRFDRSDRYVFAVGARIGVVEVRAAIDHVARPTIQPGTVIDGGILSRRPLASTGQMPVDHRQQPGG